MLIWAHRTSASIIGGNIQCLWYLLLAQAASAPDSPILYADMNLADQFAYLDLNLSQFLEFTFNSKFHTI